MIGGAVTTDTASGCVATSMLSSLVAFDLKYKPIPQLAKSWEKSTDGLTWTFHLVNTTWHDGQPFTSADVKFSFQNVFAKYHTRGTVAAGYVSSIETPDPLTVIFKLKTPFYAILELLGQPNLLILPEHLYNGTDILTNPYNWKPVGTGPFKFAEYLKGEYILVKKNENYFGKPLPYVDKIYYRIVTDVSSRTIMFDRGELNHLPYLVVPYSELPRWQNDSNVKVDFDASEMGGVICLSIMNLQRAPLNDVRVRHAIAYAMDKQEIVDKAFMGYGVVATGPVSQDWTDIYDPNVPKYAQNLTEANRLLDEAGYAPGQGGTRFSLSMLIAKPYMAEFEKAAEIMKEQLKDVGIDLNIQTMDLNTMNQKVYVDRDFDMNIMHFTTAPNPDLGSSRLYVSSNIRPVAWTNGAGYNNSEIDQLWSQVMVETDSQQRKEMYASIQETIVEDLPYLWLVVEKQPTVYSARLMNVTATIWSHYNLQYASWQAEEQQPGNEPILPLWAIATIAVIAVVVISGAAFVYWKTKRKK